MKIEEMLQTDGRMVLFAGPCVIESESGARHIAREIKKVTDHLDIDFYFKASWDKANRTKAENYRGPGLEKGLEILQSIKESLGVKIITDIHEPWQAAPVADVADILQIPAFLCLQTDLLRAAAETGKAVNVKKAQFLSPEEMTNVVGKLTYYGNQNILLCERGTCFGYGSLVVDMTGLVRLSRLNCPVIFDATHSVQISGGGAGFGNSGRREFVPYLARGDYFRETSVELVLSKMPRPEQVVICQGYVPESFAGIEDRFCFVNLDMDLYKPTLEALRWFYPRMNPGGGILIHDYFDTYTFPNLKKGVIEFAEETGAQTFPIGDDLSIFVVKAP